ncbi:Protein required for sorting proteins to the vacuole [Komagataella phaffii GS115]|uniref:Sorting nexin MVP1 n=1 Tax=Komagataella phaffii (strain GS115 / ATCC 20864) TaxID=644223 RepID=C4R422_KOMPG|nr:Protein required for sorting proteins to the vacuole [Komagataella phaffii GS115]CAY70308.1 Protein required for sorting proteins to the vacuole [Komagataella phaffii GS115]
MSDSLFGSNILESEDPWAEPGAFSSNKLNSSEFKPDWHPSGTADLQTAEDPLVDPFKQEDVFIKSTFEEPTSSRSIEAVKSAEIDSELGEADVEIPNLWSDTVQEFNPLSPHNNSSNHMVTVKEIPEKQGLLFKHINYLVTHNIKFSGEYLKHAEQSTQNKKGEFKVIRRYSDFSWLLEILLKKYPFRMIPDLPPKKFSIGATSSSNDSLFLQKRRRGLQRFLNQIIHHPVLIKEPLVIMFLTVPNDFTNWKKIANIDTSDEFEGVKVRIPTRFRLTLDKLYLNDEAQESQEEYEEDRAGAAANEHAINLQTTFKNIEHVWEENPTNYHNKDFMDNINLITVNLGKIHEIWTKLCILVERSERREHALALDKAKFGDFLGIFIKHNHTVYDLNNLANPKIIKHQRPNEEQQNLGIINNILLSVTNLTKKSKELKDEEVKIIGSDILESAQMLTG